MDKIRLVEQLTPIEVFWERYSNPTLIDPDETSLSPIGAITRCIEIRNKYKK